MPQQDTTDDVQRTGPYEPGGGASGPGEGPAVPGYQILGELGRGGMGVVYQARQTSLKRLVALKMIRAGEDAGPELHARFLSEAEAVARLRHANIVQIYEVGEAGGQPFFALEYVEGGSLAKKLAGTPQPPREAAELVRTLARAVEAAHAQGVIHRDLKPANVLLTAEGLPKVTDFGLAKQLDDESGQTQSGAILGTPSYMAPEQAEGRVHAVSPATDVYALGAILYECLTGRPPFQGATKFETLEQVRTREPVSPAQLQPKVPRDLETICLKCLHKDPAKRYTKAEQLADDLGRFLDGRPILARPVSALERAYRWCRRNPVAAGFLLTLLVATATASGLTVWALGERDRANLKTREAEDNASKEAAARQEADRQADAAWASQYLAHVRLMESDWQKANVGRILDTLAIYRSPPPGRNDLRGWEWYYQERLCSQQLRTLTGNAGEVMGVAFSPDGARLVSGSLDGTVRLWDAASGQELRTLKGGRGMVECVAFSPDGTRLASASNDGTVRLWDAASGQELRTLTGLKGWVWSVAFSPDGARLAATSFDGTMKLWDAASGQELHTLTGHKNGVWSVAFSPDGARLASAGGDGTVRLWDAAGGRELLNLRGHANGAKSVAFSPDGARLASASADRTIKLWDAASGQELRTLTGHTGMVRSVAFSPEGARLASASTDQTVRLWDAASGQELRTFQGHAREVHSVAFSPDGARLASASADHTVKLWDAADSGLGLRTLRGHTKEVTPLAFSADGAQLASAGSDWTVKLWDVASGQELRTFTGHVGPIVSVVFSPDGTRLASTGNDLTVRLWDAASGQELHTLRGHKSSVWSVAFSPDGARLASAGLEGVRLWDVASGQELRSLTGHKSNVHFVAFSADGARLVAVCDDRTVKVWDTTSGQELRTLKGEKGTITRVAVSPDGARLASAGPDQTVRLWDAATGQEVRTLTGHTGQVHRVAFSPDGTRLASASEDQTVKVWDVASGQELRTLTGHTSAVLNVAFSPDGTRLTSAGRDQTVRLWDARPLTPEIHAEREAVQLLGFLFARPLPGSEVRAALQRDKLLSEAVRNKALEFAERFKEETDPQKYHDAAWPVIRHPYANVFTCQFALAQMTAACERAPDHAQYRFALGVAQYRLGKFQKERYTEALATLTKCDPNQPLTLAFLALTQHQLGDKEQARTILARLREIMKGPQGAADADAAACLREAAAVIEGEKAKP